MTAKLPLNEDIYWVEEMAHRNLMKVNNSKQSPAPAEGEAHQQTKAPMYRAVLTGAQYMEGNEYRVLLYTLKSSSFCYCEDSAAKSGFFVDISDLGGSMQFQTYINLLIMLNWTGLVNRGVFENYLLG
ncbi:hypothetical protein BTVI_117848 [Pitangus sulphuratus]|nr:hypothetical protein BTVI_117848 [Pitangus sulphuratus]